MDNQLLTKDEALSDIKKINLVLSHVLTFGAIERNTAITDWSTPVEKDKKICNFLDTIMHKYSYGWYIVEENLEEQVRSLIKFQEYLVSHIGDCISINRLPL